MAWCLTGTQQLSLTNVGIFPSVPFEINFNEILIKINQISFKKMHFKMSSEKWRPFCLGLNVLNIWWWRKILSHCCLIKGLYEQVESTPRHDGSITYFPINHSYQHNDFSNNQHSTVSNIFKSRITRSLREGSTGDQWIPVTNNQECGKRSYFMISPCFLYNLHCFSWWCTKNTCNWMIINELHTQLVKVHVVMKNTS